METTAKLSSIIAGATRYAEPLKRFSATAWSVLSFSPGNDLIAPAECLAVEIEKGRVGIVHIRRSLSRFQLKAQRTFPCNAFKYPTPDEVSSAIALMSNEVGIRDADIVLSLPKAWVVVRNTSLPAAASQNLSQVVAFELDRFTPFSEQEALFDYRVFGSAGDSVEFVVAAAKGSTIMEYVHPLAEKGMTVRAVTFDLSSLASLCRFVTHQETFVIARIEAAGVRGGVVQGGILREAFSRDVEVIDDKAPAALVESTLIPVVERMRAIHEDAPLFLVFDRETEGVRELLAERRTLLFQEPEVDATGISGLTTLREGVPAAVGAALEYLWPKAQGNDLLSRGVRSRAKVPLMVTMVLGALILIALAVYLVAPISIEEDRLKEIDRQIALRKDEVRAVEKIKKEIEDVNREMALVARFKSEHPPAIALMRELTSIVPKNAWLTRVRIAGTQINVEGYSPSASSLIQIFEASKYFQKVEFSSPTFRDARLNMDRFQLKMELKAAPAEAPGNEKK